MVHATVHAHSHEAEAAGAITAATEINEGDLEALCGKGKAGW